MKLHITMLLTLLSARVEAGFLSSGSEQQRTKKHQLEVSQPPLLRRAQGCDRDNHSLVDKYVDTNAGATNSNGVACFGPGSYRELPDVCMDATTDDVDFTATEMCCACGGGALARCESFVKHHDLAIQGNADWSSSGVSYHDCESKCQLEPGCTWFIYGGDNGYCEMWFSKHRPRELIHYYGYASFECMEAPKRCVMFALHKNKAFVGTPDVLHYDSRSTFEECEAKCETNTTCQWFIYGGTYCELWSDANNASMLQDFVDYDTYECIEADEEYNETIKNGTTPWYERGPWAEPHLLIRANTRSTKQEAAKVNKTQDVTFPVAKPALRPHGRSKHVPRQKSQRIRVHERLSKSRSGTRKLSKRTAPVSMIHRPSVVRP